MRPNSFLVPVGLVFLAASLRLTLFSGLYGHDDWTYLFYIRSFLNGQTDELLHSLWGLRFPIWTPVMGAFKLFGVSYWATFLPGFVLGLATIPIVYVAVRKLGLSVYAATLACLVVILNPIDWLVSTTLRGDIEMSFYGGALILLLIYFKGTTGRSRAWIGLALGTVWGLSAITKEWGYVFAWGFFAVALSDSISERRFPWEYFAIAAGFWFVLAIDSFSLRLLTGDWLARLHTSVNWYQKAAIRGEYIADGSTHLRYLPDLFLGLRTGLTSSGPFPNHYPYYGPYMWLFLAAIPFSFSSKNPARPAAFFVVGILLWIEFGSMSWHEYLPYHKEPRYFSLISVPVAITIAAAGARVFASGPRPLRLVVAGFFGLVTTGVLQAVVTNYHDYADDRDFMPALVGWLEAHPDARLWTRASIQNEVDLRFAYRFSDPVHQHSGNPGYGAVMDATFLPQHRDGDFVLVQPDWRDFAGLFPTIDRRRLKLVAILQGKRSSAMLYEFRPLARGDGDYYLSDDQPLSVDQSFGAPQWDLSFDGMPIKLEGMRYQKGIGAHSHSEIVFSIDPHYPVFSAKAGLDDAAVHTPGSVVFCVYADETLKYRSPVMRSGSPAETIRLDLTGHARLKLVVEDAGDGNTWDHADWANPLMSKKPPVLHSDGPVN